MAAEQVVEQVADHIEDVAQATREINTHAVGIFFGGVGVGAVFGFILGYRFNREKIRAEAFKKSEEEVEKIRESYRVRYEAAVKPNLEDVIEQKGYPVQTKKPTTQELIEERGYSVGITEAEIREKLRPLKPPVPITEDELRERPLRERPPEDPQKRVFRSELAEKDKMDGWSYSQEMMRRSSDRPHIIHQDEFANNDGDYQQVTYVYYAGDDVLVDEQDNSVITNRDELIGPNVLTRFGHGTDDYNILYVRNPVLELEFEICRSLGSYEEEVLGLDSNEPNDVTR